MHTKAHFACCSCLNVIEKDIQKCVLGTFPKYQKVFLAPIYLSFLSKHVYVSYNASQKFCYERGKKILEVSLAL